jgi:hypothetical protein
LFELIDREGFGVVHFKDYLFGLALINESPKNRNQFIKLAFTSFDRTGKGLSMAELANLLSYISIGSEEAEKSFNVADRTNCGLITFSDFEYFVDNSKAGAALVEMFKIIFLDRSETLARKQKAWRPSVANVVEGKSGDGECGEGKGMNMI